MQSNKVITGVQFDLEGKTKKSSFYLVEPNGHEHSLIEVIAKELDLFLPVDSAASKLLQWTSGDAGPFALLISLDLKYATLREIEPKGEPLLRQGEEVLTFFQYPIQGREKFVAVLDREIGIYPTECKKFGYSNKISRTSLPRRTHLMGYGEFDPYFVARMGLEPSSAPTGSLVWVSLLGNSEIQRLGGSPEEIQLELERRLNSIGEDIDQDSHHSFYDKSGLTMSEVSARKTRAERYWDAIERLQSRLRDLPGELDTRPEFRSKVLDAVQDMDLALELHIISRSVDERSQFGTQGALSMLLWERLVGLELEEAGHTNQEKPIDFF
jgi:hypothetical protein